MTRKKKNTQTTAVLAEVPVHDPELPPPPTPDVPAAPPPGEAAASFPIVGLGASAGGLAAFEAFFSGMPKDHEPGMAFVLVQHLAPDHESLLTDLLRRYTRMQVFQVEDGMVVQPNCAYIIPPGHDMAFLNGSLQLLEPSAPRSQRLPIDFFFRSLAQDQHERAIGIVLSGTGSDGTLGVRAIKGEGGMVMAQNPASTEYDGMPRSALATGLVDYELPPAEMPAQLIAYAAHAFGRPSQIQTVPAPKTENALRKIFILLRAQTGHDFSQYKPSTIQHLHVPHEVQVLRALQHVLGPPIRGRGVEQAERQTRARLGALPAHCQQVLRHQVVHAAIGGVHPARRARWADDTGNCAQFAGHCEHRAHRTATRNCASPRETTHPQPAHDSDHNPQQGVLVFIFHERQTPCRERLRTSSRSRTRRARSASAAFARGLAPRACRLE